MSERKRERGAEREGGKKKRMNGDGKSSREVRGLWGRGNGRGEGVVGEECAFARQSLGQAVWGLYRLSSKSFFPDEDVANPIVVGREEAWSGGEWWGESPQRPMPHHVATTWWP